MAGTVFSIASARDFSIPGAAPTPGCNPDAKTGTGGD